ncbi:response regulator [Streptomyces sp. NPDC001515]
MEDPIALERGPAVDGAVICISGFRATRGGRVRAASTTAADLSPETVAPIRTVLAIENDLVREGTRSLIDRSSDIRVVGQAADIHKADALVRTLQPDVLVLDFHLCHRGGVDVLRELSGNPLPGQGLRIVATEIDADRLLAEAIAFGAHGCLDASTMASAPATSSPPSVRRLLERPSLAPI